MLICGILKDIEQRTQAVCGQRCGGRNVCRQSYGSGRLLQGPHVPLHESKLLLKVFFNERGNFSGLLFFSTSNCFHASVQVKLHYLNNHTLEHNAETV